MPAPYLARLDRAATALKAGLDERNAASLALASARDDLERRAAIERVERAYRRLEALKRAFLEAARDKDRRAS